MPGPSQYYIQGQNPQTGDTWKETKPMKYHEANKALEALQAGVIVGSQLRTFSVETAKPHA
jgi:hypothetical protein